MFLVESIENSNRTELIIFSRDENNIKTTTKVSDFRPYFYIPANSIIPDDKRIVSIEDGHKSILGEDLKKIYTSKSSDVKEVRGLFSKHYEADILFSNRYIIDVIGEVKPYPLNILYLDIETDTDTKMPDMDTPDQSITCISLVDTFSNKVTKLLLKYEKWTEETINILKNDGINICNTEEELLCAFINSVKEYDPDILSGWNINAFDLIYIIRRMQQLKIDYKKLSPLNSVNISKEYEDVTIKGRIVSDMMQNYKRFRSISNQGKAESYSLEFTSQDVLKKGKIEHKNNFREMWQSHPLELMIYNVRDTSLVKELNDKLKIIEFFNQIRCKSCSQLKDVYFNSILIDGLLLHRLHNKLVLPSRPPKGIEDPYSGAFVLLPTAGIYENVIGLDVAGMYPNIIKSFNVGFETFNPNGEIKVEDGIGFDRGIGICSQVIRDLEKERKHFKTLMKNATNDDDRELNNFRQYAIKVLANSLYGYLGFPNSRLYKKEVANAITTLGRKIIQWSSEVLKNHNYKIIYMDTDSLYVQSTETNLIKMLKEGQTLIKLLNTSYKEFSKGFGVDECTIEMDFEKIFKKIMFVSKKGGKEGAKKKYAYRLLWADGKPVDNKTKFTGFETRRSDSPRIAREVQSKVINMIMDNVTKEEIISYLKETELKIRTKKIPDEELGVPTEIKKSLGTYGISKCNEEGKTYKTGTPPVVTGARYSNKFLGTEFTKGHKPRWIYVKSVPKGYPNTEVIAFEEKIPKGFKIDYDKMMDKIFRSKLEEIFISAGLGAFPMLDSTINQMDKWVTK